MDNARSKNSRNDFNEEYIIGNGNGVYKGFFFTKQLCVEMRTSFYPSQMVFVFVYLSMFLWFVEDYTKGIS